MITQPTQHVLLITRDLMVASQLSGIVLQNHSTLRQLSSLTEIVTDDLPCKLVIIDLSQVDLAALPGFVQGIKSHAPETHTLAFGPHVQVERLQAAKLAGCDFVCHRGGLVERIRDLLRR